MIKISFRQLSTSLRDVRVRFAPSPTGSLHLGSLRTALFNFLFARHHDGKFIVRVDDTDQTRLIPGAMEDHLRTLDYFNLYRDEDPIKGGPYGPYIQSKRLKFYRESADQLIEKGKAYPCFCTEERLDLLRKNAQRMKTNSKYDGKCRDLSLEEANKRVADGENHVIRFKTDEKPMRFKDDVYGDVDITYNEGDFILLKSDGFPVYHFSTVVDDQLMKISHVIRGWEWLSSTPKHLMLFSAFDWTPPKFLHLPLITSDGRKKLSKRREDAFTSYYTDTEGYLPSAVLNFLIRNGSGIKDFDIHARPPNFYTLEEMVEKFDERLLTKANFQMDTSYLEAYGALAFRAADKAELIPFIRERLKQQLPGVQEDMLTDEYIERVIRFLKLNEEKFSSLSQMTKGDFKFFFGRAQSPDKVLEKYEPEVAKTWLKRMLSLQKSPTDLPNVDDYEKLYEESGLKKGVFFTLMRLALIDSPHGPPTNELLEFFSPEEVHQRLESMIHMLS